MRDIVVESIDFPPETVAGDFVVVLIPCDDDEIVAPPSGWTYLRRVEDGTAFAFCVSASDPPSHTFTIHRENSEDVV